MSGSQEQGFILQVEGDQTDPNLAGGSFILQSPTNSGLKNGSAARKKTKYDKLYKLYKELREKVEKSQQKKEEGETIKPQDTTQPEQKADFSEIQFKNLQNALAEVQKQAADEQSKGQLRSQQLLQQVTALQKNHKDKQQQLVSIASEVKLLQDQVLKSKDNLKAKQGEQQNVHNRVLQENQVLASLKGNFTQQSANSSFVLNDLENQKSFLANQIKSARDEISEIQKQIQNKRQSASSGDKANAELQKKLTSAQHELDELKKKYQEDEKTIKETIAKIKKQKQAEEKSSKAAAQLAKKVAAVSQVVKKLEKQEHDGKEKLNKIREQQKQKESSNEIGKAKTRNEKLKAELENSKKIYQEEQIKVQNLVRPKLMEKLKKQYAEAKEQYEKNKNLPQQIAKLQKSIASLEQQKEALHWGNDPKIKTIQDLEQTRKRQQAELARLEEFVRDYSKQEEKTGKSLEQYMLTYPEFEAKRQLRAKKPAPVVKAKQEPKKVVEEASATKKKKKGKNEQKSPDVEPQFIVQKVQKKQEPSPAKVEKKQEPPKQDAEKKKKKKK